MTALDADSPACLQVLKRSLSSHSDFLAPFTSAARTDFYRRYTARGRMPVAGNLLRNDLWNFSGLWRVVNHRVCVLNSNAIGASLRSQQVHKRIVVLPPCPVALPFEQSGNGRQTHCASLHHT